MFHAKKVGRRWNERKGGVRGRRKKKGVLLCTVKLESGFSEAAHRDEEIERKQHGCIQGYQEKTGMNKGTIDADVLSEPPGQSLSLSSCQEMAHALAFGTRHGLRHFRFTFTPALLSCLQLLPAAGWDHWPSLWH